MLDALWGRLILFRYFLFNIYPDWRRMDTRLGLRFFWRVSGDLEGAQALLGAMRCMKSGHEYYAEEYAAKLKRFV